MTGAPADQDLGVTGGARPRRLDQLPDPTAEQDLGRPFEAKTSGEPKIDAALSAYHRGRRYCLSSFIWGSPRGYRITSNTVEAAARTGSDNVGPARAGHDASSGAWASTRAAS